MSLESDIYDALVGVASGQVYPQIAPEDAEPPFVVWRILNRQPITTLNSYHGTTRYSILFEAWADSYDAALSLADEVRDAIEASALVQFRESASGADFEPVLDAFMEPVFFGFWYTP